MPTPSSLRFFPVMVLAAVSLVACQSGGPDPDPTPDPDPGCGDSVGCPSFETEDGPQAVVVDPAGNILIAGNRLKPDGASTAFYVTKLDPTGQLLWSRIYGGGAPSGNYRLTAAVDAAGGLYIAGQLTGAGDFGGIALAPAGETDAFVIKLDGEGDGVWARTFGSTDTVWSLGYDNQTPGYVKVSAAASSVTVDAQGNVLLVGPFGGKTDFGQGVLDPADGDNFVVALAGADGATHWSRQITDVSFSLVTTDPSGAVIVAAGSEDYSHAGVVVEKFDPQGGELWRRTYPGGILSGPSALRADASGNLLVTGSFGDSPIDFGNGPLTAMGSIETYVAKLSPDGEALWSDVYRGAEFVANSRLAVAASGEVILAAECQVSATLRSVTVSARKGRDVCVVRLDPSGEPIATGALSTPGQTQIADLAITLSGSPIVIGGAYDAATFLGGYQGVLDL